VQHTGESCELDVSERGEHNDEQIAVLLGVTRQRIQQIGDIAEAKYKAMETAMTDCTDVVSCADCPCWTKHGCEYPGEPVRPVLTTTPVPDWCPLRGAPLVLVVRVAQGK
jgi:hypothetical protein